MNKTKCSNCDSENLPNARYCSRCGFELPKGEIPKMEITPVLVPKKRKKYQLESIIGALFGVLAFFAIQHFVFDEDASNKAMSEIASEINKSCPMLLDSITQLDNVLVMPDNVFQYNYTLLHTDEINIEGLKESMQPALLNLIRTSPQMKTLRDYDCTFSYFYKDKNGVFLFSITVTPDDYNQTNQANS